MKKVFSITFLLVSLVAYSQDFSLGLKNGTKLYFNVVDTTMKKVEIVRVKTFDNIQPKLPEGELAIPGGVTYQGSNWSVCGIGDNAFNGATDLLSVSIPSSVSKIGAGAFSGCKNLKSVIFPSSNPEFGEKVFEQCSSLSAISLGSDWISLDLNIFADSEELSSICIPAKVNQIKGLKLLAGLKDVMIDPNNHAFSSCHGMLLSADGKVLYACPNAKSGEIRIPDSVERILDGAFANCRYITSVILPANLREFAFDEFARCSCLESITIMSCFPPATAKYAGNSVFAIQTPNSSCRLYTTRKSRAVYQSAINSTGGVYESLNSIRSANLTSMDLLGSSSVMALKVR